MTEKGGVRAAPTRQALAEFCSRAKQLQLAFIIELLFEKFHGDASEKTVRHLFPLEVLIIV